MLNQKQKDQWFSWLKDQAIPFWSTKGFDGDKSLFHERMTFDGKPCDPDIMRLMPQMRQISCFASLSIWSCFCAEDRKDWLKLAQSTFNNIVSLYKEADGKPGWVFGIDPKTKKVSPERDLYAHAFVLYGYAKLGLAQAHFENKALFNVLRDQALDEIKQIKSLFNLSFLDGANTSGEIEFIPAKDGHEQNPYMHLFEACMELFKAFREPQYLLWARRIVEFLLAKFQTSKGLVIEQFDSTWRAVNPAGKNPVEPGHLFEWCWLLGEFSKLDPSLFVEDTQIYFSTFALKNGRCRRRSVVWDGVLESGKEKVQTSRLWPQTEFLRWAYVQSHGDEDLLKFISKVNDKLFTSWFLKDLNGGWLDRLDKDGKSITEWMPSTSFYHVIGAASVILLKK